MRINLKGIYGQASSRVIQSIQQKFQLFCVIRNASKGFIQVFTSTNIFQHFIIFSRKQNIIYVMCRKAGGDSTLALLKAVATNIGHSWGTICLLRTISRVKSWRPSVSFLSQGTDGRLACSINILLHKLLDSSHPASPSTIRPQTTCKWRETKSWYGSSGSCLILYNSCLSAILAMPKLGFVHKPQWICDLLLSITMHAFSW